MRYLLALAQIGVDPLTSRELTVEELDLLIAGIDQMNKDAQKAAR